MPAPVKLAAPAWFGVQRIGPKALVRICGEVGLTGQTAAELLAAVADVGEIEISIDSIGGDSAAALEIYDGLAGHDVTVEIVGNCFSAATTIALAGRTIRMRRDATLMIHAARIFAFGDTDTLECAARRMARTNARLHALIAGRTEQPAEVVSGWLAKDSYFTAPEALCAGLIDEIVEPPPTPEVVADSSEAPEAGPTDDERLILAMLSAMGSIRVRSKAELARSLSAWLVHRVTEL